MRVKVLSSPRSINEASEVMCFIIKKPIICNDATSDQPVLEIVGGTDADILVMQRRMGMTVQKLSD